MAQISTTAKSAGAIAALALAAAAFIAPNEGLRTNAYQDIGGVWSICYGETQGVSKGMKMTPAQCLALLQKRLPAYLIPVMNKIPPDTPAPRIIAYTDFAYNAGVGAFERSPIPWLEWSNRAADACETLPTLRITVKGVVIQGLKNRRKKERDLCIQNLS